MARAKASRRDTLMSRMKNPLTSVSLILVFALASSCGSDEAPQNETAKGGNAGTGTGGAGGTSGAATGGASGASTGATSGSATGGSSGASGGSGGTSGSGTAGGCASEPSGTCSSPEVRITDVTFGVNLIGGGNEGDTQ